jgi:RNA polymerase sigma-70 factor (ECF subfamily)
MKKQRPEITPEIIAALRQQDEKVFAKFYNDHSGLIFSIAVSSLNDRQKAEDVLQEVFLKAWHALPGFEGNKLAPWLGKIAHNLCIDMLRQQKRSPAIVGKPVEEMIIVQRENAQNEIPELLDTLNPTEKEVIILKKVEGMSYQEISEITGLAEGSLRNMVVKVIKSLKGTTNEQGL